MKSVIIDIKDLTNSKEVYDSRPNPFFTIFIYGLLAMVIIALTFCYFFRIDIVVKSDGIIRTNEDISTATNKLGGEIKSVNIEDGAIVSKGDLLYTIEHNDLLLQKEATEKSLGDLNEELEFLSRYKSSIEEGKNYFTSDEDEYYTKFINYSVNLMTLTNEYEGSSSSLDQQLASVQSKIAYYQEQIECAEKHIKLIAADNLNYNGTFNAPKYKNIYDKYVSDYNSIVRQYDGKALAIQNNTNEDLNLFYIKSASEELNGYRTLLKSVEGGISCFKSSDFYSNMYDQYNNKITELTDQYKQAKEIYELNESLKGIGVSKADVESSKAAKERAYDAIDGYKADYAASLQQKISELEDKIAQLEINKSSIISKEQMLADNDTEKKEALKKYKLDNQVNYDAQLVQFSDNLRNLQDNEMSLLSEIGKITMIETESGQMPAKVVAYKNSELNSTITAIKQGEEKRDSLETNLSNINNQIGDAIVRAQMDGVVNFTADLVKGDLLQSGTAVLTIVPLNTSLYKTVIYVKNQDIAKLYVGMPINYDIYALPAQEYGRITGRITRISQDIRTDPSGNAAYYIVEATIDDSVYNNDGGEAKLKIGMACQARMITERKRIITYLLEKINLID